MDAELRPDDDADLPRDADNGLPAGRRIADIARALHKGNAAVSEVVQVAEGDLGGTIMVEHNIGNARHGAVRRDADDRKSHFVAKLRVYHQKAIDGAVHQELGVFLDQVRAAEMADGEVEEALLQE